jgi:hypothetical protein
LIDARVVCVLSVLSCAGDRAGASSLPHCLVQLASWRGNSAASEHLSLFF